MIKWYPPPNGAFEPSYLLTDWNYDNSIPLVDGHWRLKHNAKMVFKFLLFSQDTNTWKVLVLSPLLHEHINHEVVGNRNNRFYSVNCLQINCSSENITVLGSPQGLMQGFISFYFYMIHSMSVLVKEAKSSFFVKYSMHIHELVLLKKVCPFFRNCMCNVTQLN